MALNNVTLAHLKEVFDVLEEVFTILGIDYYMIGAVAREIWYTKANKRFRTTNDVDFAVLVGKDAAYDAIREYLITQRGFSSTKNNAFVLFSPGGIQVDILPFGEITRDGSVKISGFGMTSISVDGLQEVFDTGTTAMQIDTGHRFKIATLPGIILLKLIAYDDRPEERLKDAGDIANILLCYFDLQADFIYDHHADLFDDGIPGPDNLENISAIVIGRELRRISRNNLNLQQRLTSILTKQLQQAENRPFVRQMATETNLPIATISGWLQGMLRGITAQ